MSARRRRACPGTLRLRQTLVRRGQAAALVRRQRAGGLQRLETRSRGAEGLLRRPHVPHRALQRGHVELEQRQPEHVLRFDRLAGGQGLADGERLPVAGERATRIAEVRADAAALDLAQPLVGIRQLALEREIVARLVGQPIEVLEGARDEQPPRGRGAGQVARSRRATRRSRSWRADARPGTAPPPGGDRPLRRAPRAPRRRGPSAG